LRFNASRPSAGTVDSKEINFFLFSIKACRSAVEAVKEADDEAEVDDGLQHAEGNEGEEGEVLLLVQ